MHLKSTVRTSYIEKDPVAELANKCAQSSRSAAKHLCMQTTQLKIKSCVASKTVKCVEDDMWQLTHFKGPGPFSFVWCISKLENIAGCNIADSSAAMGATRRLLQLRCKIQEDFANCIIIWTEIKDTEWQLQLKKPANKFIKESTVKKNL
jgi:hypothetical protein